MSEPVPRAKTLIEPRTLKGFQDYLPEAMIARDGVVRAIQRVYESYGFVPIDTPVLEHLETLIGTGGEETNKELFRLESPEQEAVAMRFDLTVPFARVLAQYPDKLKLPFRRYHVGPVFRADKPGAARFRQFTQFDIDAAGSQSVAVDAEIIGAMRDVMLAVGLAGGEQPEFRIVINNRKVVDALLEGSGIFDEAVQKHVLRVVDKLQKVGIGKVCEELGPGRVDESGDPIRGVGMPKETIQKIREFIAIRGHNRKELVEKLEAALPKSDLTETALAEMRLLAGCLDSLGVTEAEAVFDPSLTRGLDYYTGPVFEAVLPGAPDFGSIMGGGRYDHLVERFLDRPVPATGASIGLDRFMAALTALGKVERTETTNDVLIVSMGAVPPPHLLAVAAELRTAGVRTEIYFGEEGTGFRKQLSKANAQGVPVAVIIGEDEYRNGTVAVKDLVEGLEKRRDAADHDTFRKAGKTGQVTVPRERLLETVKSLLDR